MRRALAGLAVCVALVVGVASPAMSAPGHGVSYAGDLVRATGSTAVQFTGTLTCVKNCNGEPSSGTFTVQLSFANPTDPCSGGVSATVSTIWSNTTIVSIANLTGDIKSSGDARLDGTVVSGVFAGDSEAGPVEPDIVTGHNQCPWEDPSLFQAYCADSFTPND